MDRKQFEEWFKTTDAYKLLEEMNYFKIDLFIFKEHRSRYQHITVQIAYMTWQHQQAKVEELQTLYTQQGINMLKMQKRVDAVTHLIRGLRAEFDLWMDVECPQVERQIELLEQALKGEGQ